jgi:hypothetical protein
MKSLNHKTLQGTYRPIALHAYTPYHAELKFKHSLIILIPRCPSLTDEEQFATVSHVLNLQAIAPLLDPKLL